MVTTLLRFGDSEMTKEQLVTIMLFLESLIKETLSPDVLELAQYQARERAGEMGIPYAEAEDVINRLVAYAKCQQAQHPLSGLF